MEIKKLLNNGNGNNKIEIGEKILVTHPDHFDISESEEKNYEENKINNNQEDEKEEKEEKKEKEKKSEKEYKQINLKSKNKISNIIMTALDIKGKNKFLVDPEFCKKIEKHEIFQEVNVEHLSKEDLYIGLNVFAIDQKNLEFLEYLFNNDIIKKNGHLISEIHKRKYLTMERLKFLLENKKNVIRIPSSLIKCLINEKRIDLLNILFKYSKFFDSTIILKFLFFYKYKKEISKIELQNITDNEKYKIETNNKGNYLYDACNKNHEYITKYLISLGVNVNQRNCDWDTPLIASCKNGNEKMMKYLIEHGARINLCNTFCNSPLFYACQNKNENMAKYLIDCGANVNQEEMDSNYTPLLLACEKGNDNTVKYLVEHGADIEHTNRSQRDTPLLLACKNKNENIAKYLIDQGANVNYCNISSYSPLHIACQNGNENLVKYLVEHGANINCTFEWEYETPLIKACMHKHENIVKYLIDHGAYINKREFFEMETPLTAACNSRGNENIIKYLIEHGADINDKNMEDETPLIIACENSEEKIVKYLVEHGADVNYTRKFDIYDHDIIETPLIIACNNEIEYDSENESENEYKKENENIIKYLIEHGADVNKTNKYNSTPLDIICKLDHENLSIVKLLVEHGADVNKNGPPLALAYEKEHENIIEYLIEHEADINQILQ